MKKWICTLLCLSLMTGTVSIDAKANTEENATQSETKIMNTKAISLLAETPVVDTPTVDTGNTSVPTSAPVISGGKVVKGDVYFTTTENTADKTCEITGYIGAADVTTLYIPSEIKDKKVTAVAEGVLSNCIFLKNLVVLGDTELKGTKVSGASGTEIWAKTGSRANAFATANSLTFHSIDSAAEITAKKAKSLNRATVTWSAVNGAVSYNLYRKRGKEQYALYKNIIGTSFVNERLKVGAKYTYKISPVFTAANGDQIEGVFSKEAAASLKPAKPKSVKAKGVRGGIQVRWKRDKSVSGYQVYMKVHVKGFKTNFNRVKTITKNKITGYRCKMLVRGMKYSYQIRTFKTIKGKRIYSPFVTVSAKAK